MNSRLVQMLAHWLMLALGVMLATRLIPGIRCDSPGTLIVVAIVLSLCNSILRPLLVLFTLPFILLSLGLGMIVINAILFLLVGRLVDGFYVAGFWSAVGGSLVVSATNFIVHRLLGSSRPPGPPRPPAAPPGSAPGGDVIDI
jgi:putative membrane protein